MSGDRFTGGTEQWRIKVQAQLDAWLASAEETLTFSCELSKEERRYLHEQAPRLGLVTKSIGSGQNRFITVSKPSVSSAEASRRIWLEPSPKASSIILEFGSRFSLPSFVDYADRGGGELRLEEPREEAKAAATKAGRPREASGLGNNAKDKRTSGLIDARSKLPAWEFRHEVARLVREHSVVLVTGETGCGKSTQVPQFLLDDQEDAWKCIACSQPRRLSAIAVAERVASERGEPVGVSIGYEVRFESCVDPTVAELVFLTPGVLLRKLASDSELSEYSHLVLDEVHEEDTDTEFLLVACRELVKRRRGQLKLVLMSATLAVDKLADYFADLDHAGVGCPVVSIGAKAFPVSTFYLEDALEHCGRVDANYSPKAVGISTEMLAALKAASPNLVSSSLRCAQCGKDGFLSPEELGDHAAECAGTLILDSGAAQTSNEDDEFPSNSLGPDGVRNDIAVVADVLTNGASLPALLDNDDDYGGDLPLSISPGDDYNDDAGFGEAAALFKPSSGPIQVNGGKRSDVSVLQAAVRAYQRSRDEDFVDVHLIADLVRYFISSSYQKGAVLVFVPGWADIVDVISAFEADVPVAQPRQNSSRIAVHLGERCHCVALHSSLETAKQKAAFLPPPGNKWKVVVATNVAETSITIPDVSFVIDTGHEKTLAYDRMLGASVLRTMRISRASAQQREGRAGRTRPGVCFRLWTRRRHKALAARRKSELLRANLDGLCLRAASLCFRAGGSLGSKIRGARDFMQHALNPPLEVAVEDAVSDLVAIGALIAATEMPTRLGETLARLPLAPRLGLAALYSRLLGNPTLSVACVLDAKDPFIKGNQATSARQEFAGNSSSDVVALCGAADGFRRQRRTQRNSETLTRTYCRSHGLSYSTLALIDAATTQLSRALPAFHKNATVQAVTAPRTNALVCALATVALYPNVAIRRQNETLYTSRSGARCRVHGTSLAGKRHSPYHSYAANAGQSAQTIVFGALLEYVEGSGRSGLSVATVSPTAPLSVLLLCHATLAVFVANDVVELTVPGLTLRISNRRLADIILALRFKLRAALADFVANRPLAQDKIDAVHAVVGALVAEHTSMVSAPRASSPPAATPPASTPAVVSASAGRNQHSHSPNLSAVKTTTTSTAKQLTATPRKPVYSPVPPVSSRSSPKKYQQGLAPGSVSKHSSSKQHRARSSNKS